MTLGQADPRPFVRRVMVKAMLIQSAIAIVGGIIGGWLSGKWVLTNDQKARIEITDQDSKRT